MYVLVFRTALLVFKTKGEGEKFGVVPPQSSPPPREDVGQSSTHTEAGLVVGAELKARLTGARVRPESVLTYLCTIAQTRLTLVHV